MGTTNLDSLELASNLTVSGTVDLPAGSLARADLATETAHFPIDLQRGISTITGLPLDTTGGAALLKIVAGAYGTGTLELRGNDANNNTITSTGSFVFVLPENYVSGAAITLRVYANSSGSGTITVRTIDAEAYLLAVAGTAGSDLCATTIQTLTGSNAAYDFTITPTGLVAGDKLRINLQGVLTITDATATRLVITDVRILTSVKG